MTTTSTITRPNPRVVADAVTTSKPAARRKAQPKPDPQPRAYAPDSAIGKRVATAFALKDEIDRLKALLQPHMAYFTAHCKKHNISRIDVGSKQVQYKSRANWTYSARTTKAALQLAQQQRLEQEKKIAKNKPTLFTSLALSAKAAQEG